ncbi:sulfate transport system permease protein [Bacillus niacini]|uniref:Sulfate transport system permease protein CysT n=2 Tax=Neobacillus TaxID=2675232 RepID=A0A852T8N9_9BACI|nr:MULTISPECIES: sulfate ABC transporter permease subunit CysT [Neobacillus]MDP5197791.1 sulfate ABC transporter permease subunit CysT [Neobacillus sp. 179.-C4.2 HS]MDQ0970713.1 sulfate transport system permease protein [Neobacillus niacini]NYE04157.1 sulfate transport system permease protein [Neobacillus niacini]
MANKRKRHRVLPGFGLSMGYTLIYLSLIVLIPIAFLFLKASTLSLADFWETVTDDRVVASYKLTIYTSLIAALVNAVFGTLIAWVLVRYDFYGKRIIDALVDLPFALPTAVAGIALTTIYAPNGWIGQYFEAMGIKVAYTPLGIMVALTFIGLPFVVRSVQPVLQDLDRQYEEAASTLGASSTQIFVKIILPAIFPAILTGFALAFARALGEYGSVVFISGNMPMKTEIVPLLIITKLEQFNYAGAAAIAVVMLVFSFVLLFLINFWQWRTTKKYQMN